MVIKMSENQTDPQYKLRWSEDLRDKVVESAKKNNRSINSEITTRLANSFSAKHLRVTQHDNLEEVGYTIEIDGFTIGLYQSQLNQIKLYELNFNYWVLSYYGIRCTVDEDTAKQLINLGCKYDGSSVTR